MLFQVNPSAETVTYIITAAFSCFNIYKTIQFFYSPVFFNNLDTSSVGSPTIVPDISRTESVASTIRPELEFDALQVPDPTPLMVPAPHDHGADFIDAIREVFMLLLGF